MKSSACLSPAVSEHAPTPLRTLRTLLVLGRISNLPTVWSNCLAGWWLGGAGSWLTLAHLCLGASCLYVGGMFINDAFDAEFDRQHRSDRPIPSGAIRLGAVWRWGIGWMVLGTALLLPHSSQSAIFTLLLVIAIVVYDAVHKMVAFSPILMALCRFFLLLLAASFGQLGVEGLAIWTALVLGGYIVGLSYIARRESTSGLIQFWPMIPLGAPILLAWIVNVGEYKMSGALLSLLLVAWIAKTIHPLWTSPRPAIGRVVSGLLAGICFVDLLAVADAPHTVAALFVAFFGLSLLLQRHVPAT